MGPDVCHSKTLTDATLADEDTNSILTGNANRATQATQQTMQVAPSDDQMLNQFKLCHLVDKYGTYTSGTICWPNLQLVRVVPSGGQMLK